MAAISANDSAIDWQLASYIPISHSFAMASYCLMTAWKRGWFGSFGMEEGVVWFVCQQMKCHM